MAFDELKAKLAHVWGSAPWERAADTLAPIHRHVVRVLDPAPGTSFLDVGTGTGAVALLAARTGADVTGCDIAEPLLETARHAAEEAGLDVRFETGDAENLPYRDASFDAVASVMGLIFAPDHRRAADELARVTRRGGRAAFSGWVDGLFAPVMDKYTPPLEPGQGNSRDWGREEYARELLGGDFELEFEHGEAPFVPASGEEGWELLTTSVGPFKARAGSLDPDAREQLHRELVDYLESHRMNEGIHVPGAYLLVVGTRR